MDERILVIYSGGMDSFTLLNDLMLNNKVYAVTFDYGQKHSKEIDFAYNFCKKEFISHSVIKFDNNKDLFGYTTPLTGGYGAIPEGHYADESMRQTVVPNRNMLMLTMAATIAVRLNIQKVYYGAHAGDHTIYPDCRPEFIYAMNRVLEVSHYEQVIICAPYINMPKGQIAAIGKGLGLNYGEAWTCYNGREKACGKCGACVERKEAMEYAGIDDPMEYERCK